MLRTGSLWDWAAEAYAAPGAQAALLALQDDHGQCVCLLLWAAWRARMGAAPTDDELEASALLAQGWERAVTAPLRAARRALKIAAPGVADAGREALRARVKADELRSERLLLEALEAREPNAPQTGPSKADPVSETLMAAAAAWGKPPPKALLDNLARIFEGLDFC